MAQLLAKYLSKKTTETLSSGHSTSGRPLLVRTASAISIAVPAALALYFGHPYFGLLIGIAAVCIAWEWACLCQGGRPGIAGLIGMITVAVSVAIFIIDGPPIFAAALGAGTLLAFAVAILNGRGNSFWLAAGTLYAGVPAAAMLYLYDKGGTGAILVGLLIGVVAATDIGAYFSGRQIGGPRLAPRISPAKTWSGLFGGMLLAGVTGGVGLVLLLEKPFWAGFIGGMVTAVVAQGGDLFESYVKRRYGAKDSSNLIPGHGGVMDRFDGLVASASLLALAKVIDSGKMNAWL